MTTTPAMPELPDGATVLPDGSAFATASFPLPSDHWLYAPREYRDGEEEPIELPSPILSHQAHGDIVRAAIRYAVRSATMCGKEPDFDPDALVQNAMYSLCGPFGGAALQAQPAEVSDAEIDRIVHEHTKLNPNQADDVELLTYIRNAARAILALRPQSESEPFGYFRSHLWGWTDCGPDDEGAMALYERPQAVPMTDEQVDAANPYKHSANHRSVWLNGFRAAERLYGITAPAGGEGK